MVGEIFSKRLRDLRIAEDLLQRQLAKKIGVSQLVVSRLETMKLAPSPEIIVKLANFFQVSADYLLGIKDD
jgi:transcriptional regulator with XRE-family HTH domain